MRREIFKFQKYQEKKRLGKGGRERKGGMMKDKWRLEDELGTEEDDPKGTTGQDKKSLTFDSISMSDQMIPHSLIVWIQSGLEDKSDISLSNGMRNYISLASF